MSDTRLDGHAPRPPASPPAPQAKPAGTAAAPAPATTGTSSAGTSGQSTFDAQRTGGQPQAKLLGTSTQAQDPGQLVADVTYSRLSATEEGQATLEGLGITDGTALRAYADQVAAGDEGAIQQLNDAMSRASPSFQGLFAAGLGAVSPEAGAAAVQAARAQAGNAQAEGWPEGITNGDAQQLEAWGITPQQAQEARDAVPELLAAAKAAAGGDMTAALEHLSNAALAAPELTAKAMAAMTEDLPDGPLKTALNDPQLPALLGQIARGAWDAAAATLAGSPGLLDAAGEALVNLPAVQKVLDALGIQAGDLPPASAVLPDVLKLGSAVMEGDVKGAVEAALALAGQFDGAAFGELVGKLGGLVPDSVKGFLQGLAANPNVQEVAKALASDPNLPTLVEQLAGSDWSGALQTLAQNPALVDLAGDALANIPQVKSLLEGLGVDPSKLPPMSEVLPDLLKLGQAVGAGDVKGIAGSVLSLAGKVDPAAFQGLVEKLPEGVRAFFQKLSGNGDAQGVLAALAGDPNVPTLLDELSRGNWGAALDALKQIAANPEVLGALGDAVAGIPQVQQLLQGLGLDPNLQLGQLLPDVLKLGNALLAEPKDVPGAVEAAVSLARQLGPQVFQNLIDKLPLPDSARQFIEKAMNDPLVQELLSSPQLAPALSQLVQGNMGEALRELAKDPALLAKAGARLAEACGFPQGIVDALIAAGDVLTDETFGPLLQELGAAIGSLDGGRALEAFQKIAGAIGDLATSQDPADQQKLITLLDAMSHLPGGVGKLFQDPALNEAIVRSGSAGQLVNAAKLLAEGKLEDAAEALYAAGASLLSYGGDRIEVAGQELPFTEEGITQFVNLLQGFWDALPNGVKNKVMDIIGRAVGSAVPIIGDLITGAMDAKAFIDALENGDGYEQLLAGGQLVLDAAGMLQLSKAFTQPLKFALGALQAVKTLSDVTDLYQNFQDVFFGVSDDPVDEVKTEDRAIVEAYLTPDQLAWAQQQPGYADIAHDEEALAALVQAAQACGVPPEHFFQFVEAMAQGHLKDLAEAMKFERSHVPANQTQAEHLRQTARNMLPEGDDLSAYGGSWPEYAGDLVNPDHYLNEQQKQEFEAAFGKDMMDVGGEYHATRYEAMVATARALGIPPEQFVAFWQFLQQQGVDLDYVTGMLASGLTDIIIPTSNDPDRVNFDTVSWIRRDFEALCPGMLEQFQAGQQGPTAAAA